MASREFERTRGKREVFEVTGLKDLSGVPLEVDELECLSLCCGSRLTPIKGTVGFQLGRLHKLECLFLDAVCLVCKCGESKYQANKTFAHTSFVAAHIRDFIEGEVTEDFLYQHLSIEDVGKVMEFKRLLSKRVKRRIKRRKVE